MKRIVFAGGFLALLLACQAGWAAASPCRASTSGERPKDDKQMRVQAQLAF